MRALISFFFDNHRLECRNGVSRNRTATLDARRSGDSGGKRQSMRVNPETVRIIPQPERFLLVVRQLRDAKAAKLYGVDLKVLEANGYRQLATQQQQMMQCREWGADAILLGSSTIRFPELERYAGNVPVIEVANVIRDASVATHVGLPWFQMGYLPGRFGAVEQRKTLNVLLFPGRRKLAAVRRWWRVFVRQLKAAPSTLWISPGR